MAHPTEHCQRPWWKRPPVWLLALVVLGALVFVAVKEAERPAPMPYGAFLDQLDAGNVASVSFDGTEIAGRFRHALNAVLPTGTTQPDSFRSRVPDFGDPSLIPELRKEHVAIDVRSPSQWSSLLAHLPWPMVAFVVLVLIAALVRIVRGPKAASGSAVPMQPGGGMVGLLTGFLAKKRAGEDASPGESPPEKRRSGPDP